MGTKSITHVTIFTLHKISELPAVLYVLQNSCQQFPYNVEVPPHLLARLSFS